MSDYQRRIEVPQKVSQHHTKDKGLKYDEGKPMLELIPTAALTEEGRVLAFGAQKYGPNNWRQGMAWSRLVGAALRHITQWNGGENLDPETGISHLAHARTCLGFLLEFEVKNLGRDDRG